MADEMAKMVTASDTGSTHSDPSPEGKIEPGEPRGAIESWHFDRASFDGAHDPIVRELAAEVPIALEFNGIGYAVLMASPADLVDLAYGFALSERLVDGEGDILRVDSHETEAGIILRVEIAQSCVGRILERVRHRASDSSCGICGIENLEQAVRLLPAVDAPWLGTVEAIFHGRTQLAAHQKLNRRTGAVHAAAHCDSNGTVLLVREDVGRHNAFDKLIGAMARGRTSWDGGFALLSSRCSYELVEKAVLANCPLLATISAPTALAARAAKQAGLLLAVLARPDTVLLDNWPARND